MTDIVMASPDGTRVKAGNGGGLVTSDGVWTFSTGKTSAGSYILLNGKVVGYAIATELEVANGGQVYAHDATGQWYKFSGSQWLAWVDPALEPTRSADGTLVKAGSGGGLVTNDGLCSFSVGKTSAGSYILLNGKVVGYAIATEFKVANGGQVYAHDVTGQWYKYSGSQW